MRAMYAKMADLQPMPLTNMERLASLLHRLVMACLTAPEPPGKWYILHSRRIDPGDNAPVVVRIDQFGGDLAAYRADAHLVTWQAHKIEGHTWEAFTYLWRGGATTLDGLYQKLEHRHYARDEYRQALEDLMQRNWIKKEARKYQVTVLGQEIRQAAEEATDQYFYAPWSCLSQDEMEDLRSLLILLHDGSLSIQLKCTLQALAPYVSPQCFAAQLNSSQLDKVNSMIPCCTKMILENTNGLVCAGDFTWFDLMNL